MTDQLWLEIEGGDDPDHVATMIVTPLSTGERVIARVIITDLPDESTDGSVYVKLHNFSDVEPNTVLVHVHRPAYRSMQESGKEIQFLRGMMDVLRHTLE